MSSLIFAATFMYIAARMSDAQKVAAQLVLFFLVWLPLVILLWKCGAIELGIWVVWTLTVEISQLFLILWKSAFDAIFFDANLSATGRVATFPVAGR